MCLNVTRYFGHVSTLARKPNTPFRICKPTLIVWKRQTPGGSQRALSRRWDHYLTSAVHAITPFVSFRIHPNHFQITQPLIFLTMRRMRWAGHVARMGEERGVYRVLVGKLEGKRPMGKPRRRWVDNIRMDLQEVGCGYMDWIGLAQDRDRWRTLVSAVMNLRVAWNAGNFLTSANQLAAQEGLCTME